MLDATALSAQRLELRARHVALKPAAVTLRRDKGTVAVFTGRVNSPLAGGTQQATSGAADSELVSATLMTALPELDIRREDRVIWVDAGTAVARTGRVVAVRAEPWGVEADLIEGQ